jgi:V8-like Glu-specific endopeptidase
MFSNELEMDKINPHWKKVSVSDICNFPYNCIGNIKTVTSNEGDRPNFGTGFLISPTLILTSAHTFQRVKFGEVFELVPDSFSLEGKVIKIKDSRINRKFVEILKEVTNLENEKEEVTNIKKK